MIEYLLVAVPGSSAIETLISAQNRHLHPSTLIYAILEKWLLWRPEGPQILLIIKKCEINQFYAKTLKNKKRGWGGAEEGLTSQKCIYKNQY